ncbi:S-adenosyl-L-methionine-dependent methyltransferase [Kalaharituber pfeilii]|nr:S-adenosyl-L-methionine-dependent methyltransferase [Kalaharituber pfeilii]
MPPSFPNSSKQKTLVKQKQPFLPNSPVQAADLKPKIIPKRPYFLVGLALYGGIITAYGTYLIFSLNKVPEPQAQAADIQAQGDLSHVYDRIAKTYDSNIKWSEFWMGMPLLRRSLARRMKGDVLEVSAGTGRNIKYYPINRCNSITFVDTNASMLDQARKNFRERYPQYRSARFILQDAEAPLYSPSGQGYDTVVQTMGLCSHHSPVRLLKNLESLCKKDGGKIILLEHGRSYYDWLNRILDYAAPSHAETWGCWWNRDIEGILKDSGLKVDKISRYHFGTTYWIEATPRQQE